MLENGKYIDLRSSEKLGIYVYKFSPDVLHVLHIQRPDLSFLSHNHICIYFSSTSWYLNSLIDLIDYRTLAVPDARTV